jgi:signal peptidase I
MIDWKKQLMKPRVEVVLLFATLFIFIVIDRLLPTDSEWGFLRLLFAGLVVIEMLFIVGMEVRENTQKHGWKSEVVDTIVALLVALGIWFGAIFILDTSSPVSGVVSCSMLPNLHRGDFVVVQGGDPNAYHIEMSREKFRTFNHDYSTVSHDGRDYRVAGSLYAYCLSHQDELCQRFSSSPQEYVEKKGPLTYHYEMCTIDHKDGKESYAPCVARVAYNGKDYLTNFSHDIIVYEPSENDLYRYVGDIVHRAFFVIDVEGETYYITRGDNNPVLDIQVFDYGSMTGNYPVAEENYKGKVILKVPILGYFKLLISGFWQEDEQCKWQMNYPFVG